MKDRRNRRTFQAVSSPRPTLHAVPADADASRPAAGGQDDVHQGRTRAHALIEASPDPRLLSTVADFLAVVCKAVQGAGLASPGQDSWGAGGVSQAGNAKPRSPVQGGAATALFVIPAPALTP